MTQSELSIAKKLKLRKDLKKEMPNLTDDAFVKENIAILHIYHENLHFIKQERGEVSKTQHPFDKNHSMHRLMDLKILKVTQNA